jgi:hypothetical protein
MQLTAKKTIIFLSLAFLPLLSVGCGDAKAESKPSHTVKGTVTYRRLPIRTDDAGRPVGLGSPDDAETLPLRGVTVRPVWLRKEAMPDGSEADVWTAGTAVTTSGYGAYSLDLQGQINDDTLPVYVEVVSAFNYFASSSLSYNVRVIADANGLNSAAHQADRSLYFIRKGLDGSADGPTPAVAQNGDTVLDFEIGLDDRWWIGHTNARYAPYSVLEQSGTGSRVAAIIDTAFKAATTFGNPSPGATLDLHYRRGVTEPLGTYVEYDLERSLAEPGSTGLNHVGSVRGGPQHDDAWDEGALLAMMARNSLRASNVAGRFQFPPRKFPGFDPRNLPLATHLQPTMALAEGLPEVMAATALGTPYITSSSGTVVRDIRSVAGLPLDVYSGPAIAAFAWRLALSVSGVESPGDPETWKDISPAWMLPFYALTHTYVTDEDKDFATYKDEPSLFTQLAQMSSFEGSLAGEETLAEIAAPFFGEVWPRPEEGPLSRFVADWGVDPDSGKEPIPSFSFGMSDATLDAEGRFPNLTAKENLTAKLTLTKDTNYWISVACAPSLPAGASIELRITECAVGSDDARTIRTGTMAPIAFGPSTGPRREVLLGNADGTVFYLLHFSLKSPNVRVQDTQVGVRLVPAF